MWDQLLAAVDRVRVEVYDPTVTFGVPIKTEAQEANEKVIKIEQLCIVTGVLWKGIWYAVGWGGGGLSRDPAGCLQRADRLRGAFGRRNARHAPPGNL